MTLTEDGQKVDVGQTVTKLLINVIRNATFFICRSVVVQHAFKQEAPHDFTKIISILSFFLVAFAPRR